jgi:predicted MFS family arabinose efflux permease
MPVFLRITLPLAGLNFLNQAARALIATLGPLLALEFELTASELGLLSACFFFSYALAQLPVGLAMDLFGVGKVQRTLALVAASGFAICGASTNIATLAAGRMVTGVGISVGMIAMLTAHSQWVPKHRIAAMTGTGVFIASFGGLMATLPAQRMIPVVGWRGVFWILAAVALAMAAWIAASVRDPPGRVRTTVPLARSLREFGRVFAHPAFLRFAPAIAILSAMTFTYGGLWAGPWLRDAGGFDAEARAALLLAYMAGMTVGSLASGQIASWAQARGADPMTVPAVAMAGLWLCQVALIAAPPRHPAAVAAVWFAFSLVTAAGPSGFAAVAQRFPPGLAGRVGTAMNLSMLVVVFFLQNAIGAVLDMWPRTASGGWDAEGYRWAMGLSLALQTAAVTWMVARGRARRAGEGG